MADREHEINSLVQRIFGKQVSLHILTWTHKVGKLGLVYASVLELHKFQFTNMIENISRSLKIVQQKNGVVTGGRL